MFGPVARLNAALEGRYAIERELGEGGMATVYRRLTATSHLEDTLTKRRARNEALAGLVVWHT